MCRRTTHDNNASVLMSNADDTFLSVFSALLTVIMHDHADVLFSILLHAITTQFLSKICS